MAEFQLRCSIKGEAALNIVINRLSKLPDDMRPVFREIATDFYKSMAARFRNEGAYQGSPKWADLSPAYKRWKEKHFPGRRILHRTGALKKSFTEGEAGNVTHIGRRELVVGTSLKTLSGKNLAMIHQLGRPNMPARPPVAFSNDLKIRWRGMFVRFFKQQGALISRQAASTPDTPGTGN